MRRSAVCIRPHLSPECCRALPETGSEDTYREGDARDGQDESEESIRGDPNMIVCVISRGTAGRDHKGACDPYSTQEITSLLDGANAHNRYRHGG